MQDVTSIAAIDPEIESYHFEWRRNRHVIDGARSIRAHCHHYLPMIPGQKLHEYQAYTKRVPFFPGAARTHEGLLGLIFRKPATITAPTAVEDILDTITAQGYTLDDLAEEVASELLITNFCGLVVDHPSSPSGMSRANATAAGLRPFVAVYRAESILGVETGVVNNRQRVTRVRLLDDAKTIRELRLDNGVYSITIWHETNGTWTPDEPIIPTKNGASLDEIPFTLVSTKKRYCPSKAPLNDICEHNIQHFLASANLATCHYYSSSPIYNVMGAEKDIAYSVAPGTLWAFTDANVKTTVLEYTGASIGALRDAVKDIETAMATIGSRILAGEAKAGVESADALAIRRASENATLAALARIVSRNINDALAWVSWWLDLPEDAITYEANTDYNALPLSNLDIEARMKMWQGGAVSLDTFIAMMIEHEVLPETFDPEVDAEKRAQEIDAHPPVDAIDSFPSPAAPEQPAK